MTTITISDKTYQYLIERAKAVNSTPAVVLDKLLENLLIPESSTKETNHLGDLLSNGYGLWRDREDINDSVAYAKKLREKSWKRSL
jgi:hypothetical protein